MEEKYCELYPNGNPVPFCDRLFKALDEQKKGYLTFTQFVMALKDLEGELISQYKLLFRVYDTNRNRIIDLKEMTQMIKAIDDLKGNSNKEDSKSKAINIFSLFKKPINQSKNQGFTEEEFIRACSDDSIGMILKP